MASIGGKPFIEYLLKSLKKQGFLEVILSVGYMKEAIIDYLGDGSKLGLKIDYVAEEKPLGTGGAIKNTQPLIEGAFLVLNGDSYLDIDYNEFVRFHNKKNSLLTMATVAEKNSSRFGLVELDRNKRIIRFAEKKAPFANRSSLINAGAYVMEAEFFSYLPGGSSSLEKEIIPDLIESNLPVFGYEAKGFFIDIGTPKDYLAAKKHFEVKGVN